MRHPLTLAALVFSASAFAQTATAPAAAAAQPVAVPAPNCVKPAVPELKALDKKASDALNAGSTAYQKCVQAYITERREVAKQHEAIINANMNASNALAAEFNAFGSQLEALSKARAAAKKDE